jgi:hypothetical protein
MSQFSNMISSSSGRLRQIGEKLIGEKQRKIAADWRKTPSTQPIGLQQTTNMASKACAIWDAEKGAALRCA